MLKALALTLMVATFLASGFTFAPAGEVKPNPQVSQDTSLARSETFTIENLTIFPVINDASQTQQANRGIKTNQEVKPNS